MTLLLQNLAHNGQTKPYKIVLQQAILMSIFEKFHEFFCSKFYLAIMTSSSIISVFQLLLT